MASAKPSTAVIAMWLTLAALAMLFLSGMVGYVLFRAGSQRSPQFGTLTFPPSLWLSTVLVLVGSVTVQLAVSSVRRERLGAMRRWLYITLAISVAFIAVQTPAMIQLLRMHNRSLATTGGHALYGLIFFLILLHAAHVVGGLVSLAIVCRGAALHRYDHEQYLPVRFNALYWHFLDVVWVVMFGVMFLFG
jgi:cytochrome c oxidase subunit III